MATKWRDGLERVGWTALAAGLGSPATAQATAALAGGDLHGTHLAILGVVSAAITGAVNALLVIARHRISALPNPGEGLPGLPTDQAPPAT